MLLPAGILLVGLLAVVFFTRPQHQVQARAASRGRHEAGSHEPAVAATEPETEPVG